MNGNGNGQHRSALRSTSPSSSAPQYSAEANGFDWETARQRIQQAIATLTNVEETPEVIAALLDQRTAQLAQALAPDDPGEQLDLVVVRLGREVFGLEAQYVIDMRPVERITHVPRVPAWIVGIVNWRGHVISVLDLRRRWNLPENEVAASTEAVPYLVMVEAAEMSVALIVDNVLAVETMPWNAVQEVSGTVRGLRAEYVRGVAEREQVHYNMVVILDLPVVLSDPQLIIHEEIV